MPKKISMQPHSERTALEKRLLKLSNKHQKLIQENSELVRVTKLLTGASATTIWHLSNENLIFWIDWINSLAEKENGTKS